MKTQARVLRFFGIFLIVAGIVGYLSNPAAAQTALFSGGTFGLLMIVCSLLLNRGVAWAIWAARGLCVLLLAAFAWRATVGWGYVMDGESEKLFAASLISTMLVATAFTFMRIVRPIR